MDIYASALISMPDDVVESSPVLAALGPLRDRLIAFVDEGIRSRQLQETPEVFLKWEAVNPKSTETGPEITESSRKTIVRTTWMRSRLRVLTAAHSWPEYTAADSALQVQVGWLRSLTDWFTLQLTAALLTSPTRPCPEAETLMQQAIAAVGGQPMKARATVDLGGVFIASSGMNLQVGATMVTLRRPELDDLQPEMDEHTAMLEGRELRHHSVSAIAVLDMEWTTPTASRIEVERLQSLLRLFAVSSARYVRVHEELSHPLQEDMGTLTTGPDERSYERAVIKPDDLPRLQAMASALWTKLPVGPVGLKEVEPNPVTTAFRRYCDALLRDGALLERRFASAVMGLETCVARPCSTYTIPGQ